MKVATKADWSRIQDLPKEVLNFTYNRTFTEEELKLLSYGHIPREQEDKWFMCMENNVIYIYRSWTGFCIYKIELKSDNHHAVTVNNDPDQVRLDFSQNINLLSGVLDMFISINKQEIVK